MTWHATMAGSITAGGFPKYLRLANVAQVSIRQSIPGRDIGYGLNRSNEIGRITKVRQLQTGPKNATSLVMSKNYPDNESPPVALKRKSARQRWEIFHRAIAYAKQSKSIAMQESETSSLETNRTAPVIKLVK